MHSPARNSYDNLLLNAMSAADLAILEPRLTRVTLAHEQVLVAPDTPIEYVYFLEDGIASIVSNLPETASTEIGIVGYEGASSVGAILGADRVSSKTFMQVDGSPALRISTADLRAAQSESASLNALLLRYVQTFTTQVAMSSVSNANHRMEARLARWLLMCHDRTRGDEIALTHRFMAMMLGVQRSGVTVSLHVLEGVGAIRSTRGLVTILHRARLEELAGDAYGVPEKEYRALIGPFGVESPD